jgi:putative modified peptide
MSTRFAPDVIDRLLHKLGHDDDFRSLFRFNAREALKQVGHVTVPEKVGVAGEDAVLCCENVALASKETIRATEDLLRQRMQIFNPLAFWADYDRDDAQSSSVVDRLSQSTPSKIAVR